ncbi:MAG: helix-hairpin-helix domain-containing protein [Sedimentisphaerales bacterium]
MATNSFIQQADTSQNKIQSYAFCLALSAAVCISICFVVSSVGRFGQPSEIRLESRINPNYAPQASLMRLPGIGISRAEAIVAYRQDFSRQNANKPVFQNCDDLQKIRGIGAKTAEDICEWLKFE